jgi:hypothetical protein
MRRGATYLLAAALSTAALCAGAPAALAATFVVSPTGAGSVCTEAQPCELSQGITKAYAGEGNEVLMLDGVYKVSTTLGITQPIRIGGRPGGSATITAGSNEVFLTSAAKATIHDVRINTSAGFDMESGVAERVFVQYRGENGSACGVDVSPGVPAAIYDSVCWAHLGSTARAVSARMIRPGEASVDLRNDTLIPDDEFGDGVEIVAANYLDPGAATDLTVTGTNLIARGAHEDILLTTQGTAGFPHHATMDFSHSNYGMLDAQPEFVTGTPPGTNGNQTAPPLFVDASKADFHEAPGSPTLAAGLTDPLDGALGLGGEALTSPAGCDGSPGPTDIGAYQVVGPAPNCPPPAGGSGGEEKSSPPPPPPATHDTTAPRTTITRKTKTKLFFKSSEPGSTFPCKLDKGKFKPCRSPYKLAHLKPGRHTLAVAATDAAGNTDKTPAKRTFVIRKAHNGR